MRILLRSLFLSIGLMKFIKSLVEKITPDDFLNLALELTHDVKVVLPGTKATVDLSDEAVFDEVFNAEFGLLYTLLGKVLEANFKSLFSKSGIGKVFSTAQKKSIA